MIGFCRLKRQRGIPETNRSSSPRAGGSLHAARRHSFQVQKYGTITHPGLCCVPTAPVSDSCSAPRLFGYAVDGGDTSRGGGGRASSEFGKCEHLHLSQRGRRPFLLVCLRDVWPRMVGSSPKTSRTHDEAAPPDALTKFFSCVETHWLVRCTIV